VWRDLNGLTDHSRRRALASGDALGALNCIALRDDPPALPLRGIAMASLGFLQSKAAPAAGRRLWLERSDRCARCVTVRRVDPQSGEVLELIEMPQGVRRIGP
jgi:hypothetical protein